MELPRPYREVRHGDLSYPVYVGGSLLERVGSILNHVSRGASAFLISSPRVYELVGSRLRESFAAEPQIILMDDGEQQKTLATAERILTELAQKGARRDSVAVALGGGVVGDTAGFAASIYLRGIDLIHVPTTLLAQVDSSVGGKVAVNHPLGKNLIGSFHPPKAVICDVDILSTLPQREMRSGLFEALKAGVISDPHLFEVTVSFRAPSEQSGRTIPPSHHPDASLRLGMTRVSDLQEIVERSVDVKAEIVSFDPRESDLRRLLNYGHTIGHGIEAALGYEGLTHGDAIAWGMIGANAIARRRGVLAAVEGTRINEAILALSPERPPRLEVDTILAAIEHDKKFTSAKRLMVFPRRVGACVVVEVTEEEIRHGVTAAMGAASAGY